MKNLGSWILAAATAAAWGAGVGAAGAAMYGPVVVGPEDGVFGVGESGRLVAEARNCGDFEIELTNGVSLEMVGIEPGRFTMGSPESPVVELGREDGERPHGVALSHGFWMGRYEVTQGQYEALAGRNPSPGQSAGPDRPVACVTWADAKAFCARLTDREKRAGRLPEGYVYSLPTEAQWEYACRAGTGSALNSGANLTNVAHDAAADDVAWYGGNAGMPQPVGGKQGNAWGLFDMHGNVAEWCADGPWEYPQDGGEETDPAGAARNGENMVRGGSWKSDAAGVRSASREKHGWRSKEEDIGFRVALVPALDRDSEYFPAEWMEFAWCPPGSFTMGSPADEEGREPAAEGAEGRKGGKEPQREVTLTHGFWMGKHEVTRKQYAGVVGGEAGDEPDLPVVSVSWSDATNYAYRLTAVAAEAGALPEGWEFALPTEAQWEYACRALTTNALNSGEELEGGDASEVLEEVGWFLGNSQAGGDERHLHAVGALRPNAWGIYDMHGNAWEWCEDWYEERPSASASTNPAGPPSPVGGDERRAIRGGGFRDVPGFCRAAARCGLDPNQSGGLGDVGFRLVLRKTRDAAADPEWAPWEGLECQWYKDGAAIGGATGTVFEIASVSAADAGSYRLAASNGFGSATGAAATVTVDSRLCEEVDGVLWFYEEVGADQATVLGACPAEGELEMPAELAGRTVTAVGDEAFAGCAELEGMALPDGVTNVGDRAFAGCTGLAWVECPEGLKSIGEKAFQGTGLMAASLPGLERAGEKAFAGCAVLTECTTGRDLEEIPAGMFSGCSNLLSFTVADGAASIGANAFHSCGSLTNLYIGSGVRSVETMAITNCGALQLVEAPIELKATGWTTRQQLGNATVRYYGTQNATFDAAGGRCGTAEMAFTIGATYAGLPVPTKDGSAFAGWFLEEKGTRVRDGDTVEPEAAVTLTAHWREGSVQVVDGVSWAFCADADGFCATVLGADPLAGAVEMPAELGGLRVAGIASNAFEGCRALQAMRIPAGVVEVGTHAFAGCRQLGTLTVPAFLAGDAGNWGDGMAAVEIVPYAAQRVTFEAEGGTCPVVKAGYEAGTNYDWLPAAEWPPLHVFDGWWTAAQDGEPVAATNNVEDVATRTLYAHWTAGVLTNGVLWKCDTNGVGTVKVTGADPAEGDMVVPETLAGYTVTEVGGDAFMECTNITGMAIAAGVTNIEDSAFSECWFLATVSLPEGLVSIGAWAFAHNALADLRIPDSVADIGENAFDASGSLTIVWLGTGIESVGENAFAYCDALAAVWAPVEQEGTGLLDAAGLPAGCEIHYYGTQTVTFDPNGGTCATATNAYAIGEAYGALPEAGRDGHDFAGWWDDAAGVEVTTNSIVTETAARTLVAHWKEGAVTYWDPVAGTNGVCTNYTAYTGQTTLKSGWYVVAGAITNDGRIGIDRWERNAEVNLILRDGAELVAKGGIEVAGAPEHHLVVWAQSDGPGAGKLTATAGDGSAGIGGTCDSYSAADGFKHVYGGRVTINGGAVTATGGSSGGAGIGGGQDQGCEWVTVNGGTVEAIGGGGTGGRAIGNGGSRSTYPAVMALHAGAKVLAGDDAAGAAPVAAPNRVAACLEEMYAKIGPCGPHEYEGGACKWCGAEDPLKQIVAEATGWAGTYDGAGHGVTVRVEEPASGARVRYRAGAPGAGEQTEAWSESPVLFTNACNNAPVSVEISAEGYRTVTNHAAVTIRPAALAVTAKDQEYVYNGRPQGEGDTIYDDPVQIAAKVEAAGLKGEDRIGSVELDGQATDIDIYEDLVQVVWARVCNGTNDVTGNYEIGYARGTLTIAPPWQTVTFDPGEGTCGTETNQYRWLGRYGWLPEAARTLYTFDGWWATNEAGWARVGTDDRVTESFERTLVARWLEGVATNGVRWLCKENGEGTVKVTGAVPTEGDLVMPETLDGYTVTAVGGGAFHGCADLRSMAIPDSVTEIGSQAFRECTALTNVTLGAGVTNIGDYAFEGCTSLASVAFPEGLAGIEQGAFLGSALTDAKLPDTTERIGDDVFAGCKALTNVWLGTGIESVGVFAFHLSTNLAAVWVPVEKAGTDLLAEARVPAGCEIHYYGTQTATFDANGGTCATATKDYEVGKPYGELPEARREGHSFQGWWATNAAGAVEVTTNSVVTEEASRTLEARWRLDLVALTVEAGRWGRAEAVFGGTTNVVAGGTATNFAVGYGSTVTVRAVPDGGFAVDGEGTAEFASLTNAASVAFAFLPEPTATLRWKYARNANGWFCAQIAIPWHAGYGEALANLRFLFADRTDAGGKRTAYLADTATVFDPLGTVETHEGTEYRAAAIETAGFADGERAVFGVSDETLAAAAASVPKGERKIALRVVNRNIDTVAPLDNKVGYLAWETEGRTKYLAVAPGGVVAARASSRLLSVRALNGAAAYGMPAAAVAGGRVTCRITAVETGADGVEGRFAVAAEDAGGVTAESGALAEGVRLRVYGAESLGGTFAELDAAECGVELTGRKPPYGFRVARPGGARFFGIALEAEAAYE